MARLSLAHHLFDSDREQTPGEALFFRLFELYIVGACVSFAWTWGSVIPRLGDVVEPLGMAHYLDVSVAFGTPLALISAVLTTGLLALGFLRVWRWAYLAGFVLLHFQFVTRFSQGFDPHGSHLLGVTLLGFALGAVLFAEEGVRNRFVLGYTYFFLGLGYTSAAFSKFVGTGLLWADGRHMWMWIGEKSMDAFSNTGVYGLSWIQQLAMDHYAVAAGFLVFGLLTELFAFLMWWRPFRYPMVLAVLALHVGIFLVMNILSTFVIGELILLGLPWAAWLDRLLGRERSAAVAAGLRRLAWN